ncbi:signal transduction histidine kinase [Catalinimonas alkaloidigena]|uniref:sensor histidine kinase n=1 Tax=Catalinimonas alkaloidigena TaxID=1075417 RepID=UPI0024069B20|nr:HAMP domain-containing sensor histidine kinase [Catalinimonas alkaloidigena]MDF9799426.1 signal transduction histidine kinase [Catalinimonas alkaloidigena]
MEKRRQGFSFLNLSKEERQKFLQYNYTEDKYNFSRGALVAALINLCMLPIEFMKMTEYGVTFWIRVSITLLFISVYLGIKNYRGSAQSFQWISWSLMLVVTLAGITNDFFSDMHDLFLSNFLTGAIFFLHVLSGLYLRKSVVLNAIILLIYTAYAFTLGQSNEQLIIELPDLVSISLFAAFFGYLVQKNKYDRYQQSLIIERQYEEIRKEHDEYQKLNTVKDRLLSILSHDVRSPLDSLQGFVHLLENKLLNKEEVDELLPSLKAKLSRTTEFVGHTLLWTKNQIGGFTPKLTPMNVKDLLQKTVNLYEHHLKEKEIEVEIDCADSLCMEADEEMAYIVARNLLNNAIKFTPRTKTIVLAAEVNDHHIVISVIDEGVGISEEQVEHIFSVIQQPSLGTRGEKGTGLGLSLSKEFMEKIGGDLTIESNKPRAGATSRMYFPKSEA